MKQQLADIRQPSALADFGVLDTISEQLNAINEKLERKVDPRELAKEVIKEVLNPLKSEKNYQNLHKLSWMQGLKPIAII